jgi:short-subunit dehydrogenase
MIQVNVTSLVELTGLLLPAMVARSSGRILNVASTASFQPGPGMAIYYATKAFVLSFTEAIAEENRRKGVSVTALCPGPTDTEFQGRAGMLETPLFSGALKIMSAAEVAEIGYRAMLAGKVLSIAGLRNRLGMVGLRLAPRSWVRRIVYGLHRA